MGMRRWEILGEMVQGPQINAGKDYIRRLRRLTPIKTDFVKILFAFQKIIEILNLRASA